MASSQAKDSISLYDTVTPVVPYSDPYGYETPGWTTPEERWVLFEAARLTSTALSESFSLEESPVIYEIGALAGRTTEVLLRGAEAGRGANIVVVDPYLEESLIHWQKSGINAYDEFQQTMARNGMLPIEGEEHAWISPTGRTRVILVRRDSQDKDGIVRDLEKFFPKGLPETSLRFADGGHTIAIVRNDINGMLHGLNDSNKLRLRNRGVLAVHDSTNPIFQNGPFWITTEWLLRRDGPFRALKLIDTTTLMERTERLTDQQWRQNVRFVLARLLKSVRATRRIHMKGVGNFTPK